MTMAKAVDSTHVLAQLPLLWFVPLVLVAILWWWIKLICQRRGYVPGVLDGGLLRRVIGSIRPSPS